MVKISEQIQEEIHLLWTQGTRYRDIAETTGVSRSTVLRYVSPKTREKHNTHALKNYRRHRKEKLDKMSNRDRRFYYNHYHETWRGFTKCAFGNLVKRGGATYTLEEFRRWFDSQPRVCYLCGATLVRANRQTAIDHYIPITRGGDSSLSNLRLSCQKCNELKRNYTMEEVFSTIEKWKSRVNI